MNGILYFSSTGNSLQIAKAVAGRLGGQIKYIPRYCGDGSEYDKIILVSPVYSFGLPVHVYDLLQRLNKSSELTVILNYGGMASGADRFVYELALKYGLNIKSVFKLKMPENFTVTFTVPKFYLSSVLRKSQKRINGILNLINSSNIPKKRKTHERVYFKNKRNWHIIGSRLSVTDACVRCGKCESLCPSHNISVTSDGVKFGDGCVACLGCYHRCPQKAVVYMKKRKKDRYVNPYIDESDIGKDFV